MSNWCMATMVRISVCIAGRNSERVLERVRCNMLYIANNNGQGR